MTHHRVVPADLVALRELGPWLREVIRPHVAENWLDLTMSAIELAVQEVAVNIVVHGLGSQPGASFEMTAQAARAGSCSSSPIGAWSSAPTPCSVLISPRSTGTAWRSFAA